MGVSANLRWALLVGGLLALIIGPFLVFESVVTGEVMRLLELQVGPVAAAVLIAVTLAFDVLLPVSSSLVSIASGAVLGFGGGALVCWLGMTLGCMLGYWIGATGGTAAMRRVLGAQEIERARRLAGRVGPGALVVARAVPVLAEASAIGAGAARLPWRTFLIVTGLANVGIALVYAAIGAYAFETNSFLMAFAGAVAVPALGIAAWRLVPASLLPFGESAAPAIDTPRAVAAQRSDVSFAVQFDYPVVFTDDVFDPENRTFLDVVSCLEPGKRHRIIAFADSGVVEAWPDLSAKLARYVARHEASLQLVAAPIAIPGGERGKHNPELLDRIHETLRRAGVDRQSFVLAIGGGAVLDVVGYAAATAHRGIRLIRLPTTVLAQNDAGIGVKNGVNKFGVKNFAGTFQVPFAVINDFGFLRTLGPRDRLSGLAEAVKVALIRDADFFRFIEANAEALARFEPAVTEAMIRRCAALHLAQITGGGDPFETGSARPLDFGHWSAHRLESLTDFALRHGEAVAIGVAIDTRYAVLAGYLADGVDVRVMGAMEQMGFRLWHPALDVRDADGTRCIMTGLREFQEHLGGELTITLLSDIGVGVEVTEVDHALMAEAMDCLRARKGARCG